LKSGYPELKSSCTVTGESIGECQRNVRGVEVWRVRKQKTVNTQVLRKNPRNVLIRKNLRNVLKGENGNQA
jgi:hypothetical protein